MRRSPFFVAALLLIATRPFQTHSATDPKSPNIVVILADDFGVGDI